MTVQEALDSAEKTLGELEVSLGIHGVLDWMSFNARETVEMMVEFLETDGHAHFKLVQMPMNDYSWALVSKRELSVDEIASWTDAYLDVCIAENHADPIRDPEALEMYTEAKAKLQARAVK